MYYVVLLETVPCYYKKILFRSAEFNKCKKFIRSMVKSENVFIINSAEDIIE